MAMWRKVILGLSLLVTLIGGAAVLYGMTPAGPAVSESADVASPKGPTLIPTSTEEVKTAAQDAHHWFVTDAAPVLLKWGGAFFAAFVLGFAFRHFVKWAAAMTAVIVVLVAALEYFDIVDVVPALRNSLANDASWVNDMVAKVSETVKAHLPTSIVGFSGFVVGFLRR